MRGTLSDWTMWRCWASHGLRLAPCVQVGLEVSAQPASLEQGLDVRPAVQPIGTRSQRTGAQQHQGDLDRLQWIHARKPRAGRTAPRNGASFPRDCCTEVDGQPRHALEM